MNIEQVIDSIECFHNISTDFITGENPPYHRHDNTYEIYLYIKGNTKLYVEQNCYQMSPGDLIIVYPGELHRSVILDNSPYERIGINIDEACLNTLSTKKTLLSCCFKKNRPANNRILHLASYDRKLLIRYTDEYLYNKTDTKYGNDLLCLNLIIQILVMLNRLSLYSTYVESVNIMPEIVTNTMAYIDTHLTDEITLEMLGNELNYNGSYISMRFKQTTGMTLREYIFDKKIENAKKLLLSGKNVTETCSLAGFNDYSNFIRSFTIKTGLSPAKWVKNNYTKYYKCNNATAN